MDWDWILPLDASSLSLSSRRRTSSRCSLRSCSTSRQKSSWSHGISWPFLCSFLSVVALHCPLNRTLRYKHRTTNSTPGKNKLALSFLLLRHGWVRKLVGVVTRLIGVSRRDPVGHEQQGEKAADPDHDQRVVGATPWGVGTVVFSGHGCCCCCFVFMLGLGFSCVPKGVYVLPACLVSKGPNAVEVFADRKIQSDIISVDPIHPLGADLPPQHP